MALFIHTKFFLVHLRSMRRISDFFAKDLVQLAGGIIRVKSRERVKVLTHFEAGDEIARRHL